MIGAAAAEAAARWIGTPPAHGASARGAGADCLGLVRGVWAELDIGPAPAVPSYGADWAEAEPALLIDALTGCLIPLDAGPAGAGDVLLFRLRADGPGQHLGIADGAGGFVHAYARHGVVRSPLSEPWARRIAARFAWPPGRAER